MVFDQIKWCAHIPDIDAALRELGVAIVLVVVIMRIVITVTIAVAIAIAITMPAPVRIMPRLRKPEPEPGPGRKAALLRLRLHLHLPPPTPPAKAHDRIAREADAEALLRGAQLDLEQVDEARRGALVGRLERVAAHEHFRACLPRREFRRWRRRRGVRGRLWRVRERGDGERGEDEEDRKLHCADAYGCK